MVGTGELLGYIEAQIIFGKLNKCQLFMEDLYQGISYCLNSGIIGEDLCFKLRSSGL